MLTDAQRYRIAADAFEAVGCPRQVMALAVVADEQPVDAEGVAAAFPEGSMVDYYLGKLADAGLTCHARGTPIDSYSVTAAGLRVLDVMAALTPDRRPVVTTGKAVMTC